MTPPLTPLDICRELVRQGRASYELRVAARKVLLEEGRRRLANWQSHTVPILSENADWNDAEMRFAVYRDRARIAYRDHQQEIAATATAHTKRQANRALYRRFEGKIHLEVVSLAAVVLDAIQRLDRPDWPKNGAVDHHGFWVECPDLILSFLNRDGRLMITMYGSSPEDAATHNRRVAACATVLNTRVNHFWNGLDGLLGVSVVFDRPAPESLTAAMTYPSTNGGHEVFRRWFDEEVAS